jgi:uncharacterized protein YciI
MGAMRGSAAAIVCVGLAIAATVAAQSRYPAPENMRTIHIALLYRGPAYTTAKSPELDKLQEAHLAHLTKLAQGGHALIAGPMGGDGDLRGIVMLKADTADAAKALEADDPAVKAGRLRIEMVSYMTPSNWFAFGPIKENLTMRNFVFGFLNVGPNPPKTVDEGKTMQEDHLANLWAMRQTGALVAAGPAVNSGQRAGVVVFALDSLDQARALLEQDPGVKSGRFTIELYQWYAADGILTGKGPGLPSATK